MQDTFDRILKVCNMQHYGTHSLRHTFATKLLEKTKIKQNITMKRTLNGILLIEWYENSYFEA